MSVHAIAVNDTIPIGQQHGLVSTTWDPTHIQSPAAKIPLMDSPRPSFNGNAQLSFPIQLPEGRKGHQPFVTIEYNNEGGKSWLGNDWDLGFSQIIVDTRWGVPRYSTTEESELYLLDGEQLGPVFHRATIYEREADRKFYFRQDLNSEKIVRHGNSTKDYWWEVRHTDGRIDYYGGSPAAGKSDTHTLSDENGHIVQWEIHSSWDIYDNVIAYQYQKKSALGGENIYPLTVQYNGHKSEDGPYKVTFGLSSLSNRKDASINYRTGKKIVINALLETITVSYQDQTIRSYKLFYTGGQFGLTLLSKIEAYGSDGSFFYDYDFEYYDDISNGSAISAYSSVEAWTVPKDNVPVGSIAGNIEGFNAKPTILGGATTTAKGTGLAVTVGPPFNSVTKDYSAGPNSSVFDSQSEGVIAFVDIDGDGLPDKVWKGEDGLYFRSNLIQKEGRMGFGPAIKINGIKDFTKESTFGWTVGAELTAPPVFGAYFHEETTSSTYTYFADFNGDELLDIVSNGQVFFNHINSQGVPTFTTSSADTPSPIIRSGEVINDTLSVDEWVELYKRNPLHDVVRTWKAPFDGDVLIDGGPKLLQNNSPEAQAYTNADGVNCYIQTGGSLLYTQRIEANDFSRYDINGLSVLVNAGDYIYFRVSSVDDGLYDQVDWVPTITYQNRDLSRVDDNLIPLFHYNSSTDFLSSGNRETYIPKSGVINISGQFTSPALSDTVFISLSGALDTTIIIPPWRANDTLIALTDLSVIEASKIKFTLWSKSNVDWAKIEWHPQITYSSFDDGSSILTTNGDPIYRICPDVDVAFYHNVLNQDFYVAPFNGSLSVMSNYNLGLLDDFYATVKVRGSKDTLYRMEVDTNLLNNRVNLSTIIDVEAGDSIWYNMNGDISLIQSLTITHSSNLNGQGIGLLPTAGTERSGNNSLGPEYRGWGQFGYNPAGDVLPLINLSTLNIDTTGLAGDTTLVDPDTNTGDLSNNNINLEDKFIVMVSDPKAFAWRGSDDLTYVTRTTLSSTRYGLKNLSQRQDGEGLFAPALIVKTRGDGGFGGLGLGPAEGSLGYTAVRTWSTKDIGDFNGDRYPDIISENSIQYTDMRGGLSSQLSNHDFGIHEVDSEAWAGGLGRSPATSSARNAGGSMGAGSNKSTARTKSKSRSNTNKSKSANKSARNSVGISGNLSGDQDEANHTFLDINGDGLEDKVWMNGDVALGTGYGFEAKSNWGFTGISAGSSFDAGAGVGINISNGSIQGGVSATRTSNKAELGFVDVNDDALLDQIVSINPLKVRINTGSSFLPEETWLDAEAIYGGVSIGESANTAFTFCLEFVLFRVCFNPSTFAGQGSSGITTVFQDINGDGYVDYLTASDNDANLNARNSKVARTNFLKKINLPLNGSYTLDYDYRGNTYDLPFSKWVLTSVEIADGVDIDGPNITQLFDYSYGKYDRHERQFYGFRNVNEYHLSTQGDTLRSIISLYDMDHYYTRGMIQSQTILNHEGAPIKETRYTYTMKSPESGATLPEASLSQDNIAVFPALTVLDELIYDVALDSLEKSKNYEYDIYGNVTKLTQVDEGNDVVEYRYTYQVNTVRYFAKSLLSESTLDNGVLLRKTDYVRDSKGNAEQTKRMIDESTHAITDATYDEYSNLLTLLKPRTEKAERLELTYTYDDTMHHFLVSEQDGYGLKKQYLYDYSHQTMVSFIDQNGNEKKTDLDEFGRVTRIINPLEIEAGLSYSIQYDYDLDAENSYTSHKYYHDEGDIEVVVFADGVHRDIQTKRSYTFENGDGFIVSGWTIYDDLGREAIFHHPSQSNGSPYTLDISIDPTTPDMKAYDVLDRVTSMTDTYGAVTSIDYAVSTISGIKVMEEKITNPLGDTKSNYRDFRGNFLAIRVDSEQGDLWTTYEYDGENQIVSVKDANDNLTNYTYDGLGARITVNTPEGGLTKLTYDAARNLTSKSTATIRYTINEDEHVRYTYDIERLVAIDYPKNFQNKVQLHYGTDQDSFNRKGRIWLIEDASGGREFFFDYEGRVVKEIRTMIINRTLTHTFVTAYEYDSWGRIIKLTYPDGELVTYKYNKGGELINVKSERDGYSYEILDHATYDKYQDRRTLTYGNGITNSVTYDDKGRLVEITSEGLLNRTMEYDKLDNLVEELGTWITSQGQQSILKEFTFDIPNRLSSSTGLWSGQDENSYDLFIDYDGINNPLMKSQNVATDNILDPYKSRTLDYQYDHINQPTRPSEIGGKTIDYDGNSNMLLISSAVIFDYDQHIYDEENRLSGASNNGYKSRYTYDAFGHRAIKSHGTEQGLFVNGAAAGFIEHTKNYTADANPYFTFKEDGFYKHYFVGDRRVLTKKGTGKFNTTLSDGPDITAGSIDYKKRIQDYEKAILQYYEDLKIPPGPPTLLAYSGQPEINTIGLPNTTGNGNFLPPRNWPNIAPPDTTGPPGPPIFYQNAGLTNASVAPGFNHVDGTVTQEVLQNFYHYDVVNNVLAITDFGANLATYNEYLPTGEIWISSISEEPLARFAFAGLTLDEETGYYNLGNTYFDPATNLSLSSDHILQTYGEKTIQRRIEGNFFGEYSDGESIVAFDNEILNSERPDPLVGSAINVIAIIGPDDENVFRKQSKAKIQHDKAVKNKAAAQAELKSLQRAFEAQVPDSPSAFYYEDFGTFAKYKLEENNYNKKQKKKLADRKKMQRSKRKVRFN